MARNDQSFKSALLIILCDLLAAVETGLPDLYSWNTFCDPDNLIVFVRTTHNADGDITGSDGFYIDASPYVGDLDDLRLCG